MEKEKIYHSVRLEEKDCKGCTTCMRSCPTQAIRVQSGKARIIKERCIDCGECVRRCPYHAKKVLCDSFDALSEYKYNIALPAPAFCGQFSKAEDIESILSGLLTVGFDDVVEVARGAEVISEKTREILKEKNLMRPVISSACPAVVRLIAVRFPSLSKHVIPLTSPMEAAAQIARSEARKKTGLCDEDIGVFFISPCTAKITAVKQPIAIEKSAVSGVIPIKDVYMKMAHKKDDVPKKTGILRAGRSGVYWARSGGEAQATGIDNYICVDGIHNVVKVLEAIEDEKLRDAEFIEALACFSGCTGGPLNVENDFVANSRIRRIASKEPMCGEPPEGLLSLHWDKELSIEPIKPLSSDMGEAMRKMALMEEIYERLPRLDCGSCGSPTCREFAEDIVRGKAQERDCIFRLREKIQRLAHEITELGKMINE